MIDWHNLRTKQFLHFPPEGFKKGELAMIVGSPKYRMPNYSLNLVMGAELVPKRRRSWQVARAVGKLFAPRPMPTHYITPFDMQWQDRVKDRVGQATEMYWDYEITCMVIDSLSMFTRAERKDPAGTKKPKTDPWEQYRPKDYGYYDSRW